MALELSFSVHMNKSDVKFNKSYFRNLVLSKMKFLKDLLEEIIGLVFGLATV